jgi:cytoskeletal protein CcmA (bactofilin family)
MSAPSKSWENDNNTSLKSADLIASRRDAALSHLQMHIHAQGSLSGKIAAKRIVITETGRFSGAATCEIADVAGRFEGISLVCTNKLTVKGTGHLAAAVTYTTLSIESGGILAGSMTYKAAAPETTPAAASTGTAAAARPAAAVKAPAAVPAATAAATAPTTTPAVVSPNAPPARSSVAKTSPPKPVEAATASS